MLWCWQRVCSPVMWLALQVANIEQTQTNSMTNPLQYPTNKFDIFAGICKILIGGEITMRNCCAQLPLLPIDTPRLFPNKHNPYSKPQHQHQNQDLNQNQNPTIFPRFGAGVLELSLSWCWHWVCSPVVWLALQAADIEQTQTNSMTNPLQYPTNKLNILAGIC